MENNKRYIESVAIFYTTFNDWMCASTCCNIDFSDVALGESEAIATIGWWRIVPIGLELSLRPMMVG